MENDSKRYISSRAARRNNQQETKDSGGLVYGGKVSQDYSMVLWKRGFIQLVFTGGIIWMFLILTVLLFHIWSCQSSISFFADTQKLTNLITAIIQRVGDEIDCQSLPQILYEDEDHDKVVLASDGDLQAAVEHARQAGWKGLRLHLDYMKTPLRRRDSKSLQYAQADAWDSAYSTVAAGAALMAGLGVLAFLRRSGNELFRELWNSLLECPLFRDFAHFG